jgi:biotin carboxyl carrier protein
MSRPQQSEPEPAADRAPEPAPLPNPRGVRVAVAATSVMADLPAIILEPSPASGPAGQPALVDGRPVEVDLAWLDTDHVRLEPRGPGLAEPAANALLLPPAPAPSGERGVQRREVVIDGWRVEVEIEAAARAALRERARRGHEAAGHSGPTEVHAIIPGVVVSVSVAPGDDVVAGQQLLAVEAMKMQNELRSPRDGTIERVAVAPGTTIEVGDLLLVLS